jgi:hypothetical protein
MRSSQNPGERFKVLHPIILLLLVSLVFGLIFFGYQGAFSRLMADDYCYAAKGRDLGLFQGLWDIYTTWSGRYSAIILILAIEPLVEWLVKVIPAILLLVWLGSLIRLFISIQNGLIEKLPHWFGWTMAALILYLTILIAPNRFQILYWLNGSITYTLPLICLTALAGWSISIIGNQRSPKPPQIAGFGLLAFVAGGFSETNAALQVGFFTLAVIGCSIILKGDRKKIGMILMGTGLFFSFIAMVILVLSPGNHIRQELFPDPPGFFTLIYSAIRYALAFIYHLVLGYLVPVITGSMVSFIFGVIIRSSSMVENLDVSKLGISLWKIIAAIVVVVFGLIVCCMAPSAYAQSAYPELRALLSATYIFILGMIGFFLLVGYFLSGRMLSDQKRSSIIREIALIILLFGCAYPFFASKNLAGDLEQARVFASKWDEREKDIQQAVTLGEKNLTLPGLDSQHGISDLQVEPEYWVNSCMAEYYRVDSITGK